MERAHWASAGPAAGFPRDGSGPPLPPSQHCSLQRTILLVQSPQSLWMEQAVQDSKVMTQSQPIRASVPHSQLSQDKKKRKSQTKKPDSSALE